jgi:hypothetical protein
MPDYYGTAAGFRIYHAARDNPLPADAADDDYVEAKLLKASEWIDGRYRCGFGGLKVGQRAQIRDWPRSAAFDIFGYSIASDVVPTEVENATYEAALKEMNSPGVLSVDYTPPRYKSATVVGAVSVTYNSFNGVLDLQTHFAIVDQILSPILTGMGLTSSLSGSVARV